MVDFYTYLSAATLCQLWTSEVSFHSILRMRLSPARTQGFDGVSNDAAVVSRFFKGHIK